MLGFRMAVVVIGIGLLAGVCGCSSKASARPTEPEPQTARASLIKPGKSLFRSHEFRSSLQVLPQWTRVMAAAETQIATMAECRPAVEPCSSAAISWQRIMRRADALESFAQLKTVNAYFNQWPYRLDLDAYGSSDYWATPEEFLRLSGDCEDYSITKYYALRNLGFDVERMRIVLLKDLIRNISHAVLAVEIGQTTYILDNMSDLVLSHLKYEHYIPQYSVNEFYRWAHISPDMMQQDPS